MKKKRPVKLSVFGWLLISGVFFFSVSALSAENTNSELGARDAVLKTAIIHYKYPPFDYNFFFDIGSGKKALEIFQKGKKERLEIFDGKDTYYEVNFLDNTVFKVGEQGALFSGFLKQKELNKERFVKKEQFLGKECNVYKKDTYTFYFWNGILLKEISKFCTDGIVIEPNGERRVVPTCDEITMAATNIELNVLIPQDKFQVPAGMRFITPQEAYQDNIKRIFEELNSRETRRKLKLGPVP